MLAIKIDMAIQTPEANSLPRSDSGEFGMAYCLGQLKIGREVLGPIVRVTTGKEEAKTIQYKQRVENPAYTEWQQTGRTVDPWLRPDEFILDDVTADLTALTEQAITYGREAQNWLGHKFQDDVNTKHIDNFRAVVHGFVITSGRLHKIGLTDLPVSELEGFQRIEVFGALASLSLPHLVSAPEQIAAK